jgi:FkbM family methyltransferase
MKTIRLPDGTGVKGPRRLEARYLYQEIFVDRVYNGYPMRRGGTVVDAGANIGLFGLWASRHLEPDRMLMFEPIPDTFRALDANAREHFPAAQRFNIGLATRRGTATFRHYPGATGWASMIPREDLLRESLFVYLQRGSLGPPVGAFRLLGKMAPAIQRRLYNRVCDGLFADRVDIDCPVTTLSDVIVEHEIDRIDLLKLDVEGAELEVLEGLEPEHRSRLATVSAEVEDVNGSLAKIRLLLDACGMETRIHQPDDLAGTPFHLVRAWR